MTAQGNFALQEEVRLGDFWNAKSRTYGFKEYQIAEMTYQVIF